MRRRWILILLLALPLGAGAQENSFSLNADYLSRGELRRGGLYVSDDGDDINARFIIGRTRLVADYSRPWLSARMTAQHSGTWGSAEGSSLSIFEAWAEMRSPKGLFAKVGRQVLSYDDQRIFGADDWSMTGMSHDGLKVGYEGHGHRLHLFGAYNQDLLNIYTGGSRFSGGIQPYKFLGAAWYHYEFQKVPIGASLLFVNIGLESKLDEDADGDGRTFNQKQAGAFLSWHPKKFGLEAAYYHQWGRESSNIPVDAWMASVKATAAPSAMWAFRAGYDYLSGEENFATPPNGFIGLTHHEIVRGFSSLYGSNHKFYGAMDFFYVSTYVNGFTPGLQNLYVGGTFKPGEKLTLDIAGHFLSTATQVRDAKKALGHEVELSASFAFNPSVSLSAGYTFMQGTETMAILKRSSNNNRLQWGWLMLQITPKFFSTKW